MTGEEQETFNLLKLANEYGKFGIPVWGAPQGAQIALEAMQVSGWVRLIDVSPVALDESRTVYRIFLASPEAMTWYRSQC